VPEGTPNYIGASGTINTCTAQGFIYQMLSLTVPTYYGSLSLQAFMGIRNKFQEKRYRWIEYPIHFIAWCVPAALATIVALTDNFNPGGTGCSMKKGPPGCESDPDVTCDRGEDIALLQFTVGLGVAFLYFVFPPSVIMSMHCWIKKMHKNLERCTGMQEIRANAQKKMMQKIAIQVSVYLFSFWLTFTPSLIIFVHFILTGKNWIGLHIFANCVFSSQGFVMAMVYFTLERLGTRKLEGTPITTTPGCGNDHLTVRDIRTCARNRSMMPESEVTEHETESLNFNIFDGVPDEDSPWAKYFDQEDDYSDDANGPDTEGLLERIY